MLILGLALISTENPNFEIASNNVRPPVSKPLQGDAIEGFNGAQVSAHGADIPMMIFGLHTAFSGQLRVDGLAVHGVPIEFASGQGHGSIPI